MYNFCRVWRFLKSWQTRLANSQTLFANLFANGRLAEICPSWQTRTREPGFANCLPTLGNFGFANRVCQSLQTRSQFSPGLQNYGCMLPAMQFLANLGVLWHFFWQFLFLVGWPTLANVCQRWLANILDSLPTGSEKIVKEPVGKLVCKQGLAKNKLGNVKPCYLI